MTTNLKIFSIIFSLLLFIIITIFVQKSKISIKYAIIWYLSCLFLIILTLFPSILEIFTSLFGVRLQSNFVFALLIGLLLVITISLTMIVSEQKEQIRRLIQEVSTLKKEIKEKK